MLLDSPTTDTGASQSKPSGFETWIPAPSYITYVSSSPTVVALKPVGGGGYPEDLCRLSPTVVALKHRRRPERNRLRQSLSPTVVALKLDFAISFVIEKKSSQSNRSGFETLRSG